MKDLILKHALINAIEHDGKADLQAVIGKVISEDESLKSKVKEIIPAIKKTVEEINSLPLEKQKRMLDEIGVEIKRPELKEEGLPELPDAKLRNVVLRLAPFPSGPLHIGNARMVVLNDEYARMYKGRLFLVFDDTIGSEVKFVLPEAYKLIEDGLKWLGVKYSKKFYKSDRLPIFYKAAEELIKKDAAYICKCDAGTLRNNRVEGIACEHRSTSIKENLAEWKLMLKGKYKEGKIVLRLKTDIQHPNPAFRDRVLFRVAERKHPRVGTKYKVWPMLEFSWAVDDHLLGITHIIRGKDLVIEDMMENYIWDLMGWKKPEIIHHGFLTLGAVKLSKTESRIAIEKKEYSGWEDPRTWSMQSLAKRGIQPGAIRNFISDMGLSMADVAVPEEILYSENRKLIDAEANRYFCVIDPVVVSIKGAKIKTTKALLHPDFPKRGNRKIPVNANKIYVDRIDFENLHGKEVGLMNLFSAILKKNPEVTSKDVKFEIQKIHWVSEPNVKIKIVMPNGKVLNSLAEPSVKKLKKGSIVQFPRIGFARLDKNMTFYFAHK